MIYGERFLSISNLDKIAYHYATEDFIRYYLQFIAVDNKNPQQINHTNKYDRLDQLLRKNQQQQHVKKDMFHN